MTTTRKPRAPKGTPTDLNLYVLDRTFGPAARVPNRVEPTSTTHLRRCMKAGLVEAQGSELVLTPAGHLALSQRQAKQRAAEDRASRIEAEDYAQHEAEQEAEFRREDEEDREQA